jgi:teichuronic acid exporter
MNQSKNKDYLWKYFERLGTQLIQFFLQLILARILLPEDYGLVAIVSIFILFAEVIVQSGLGAAIIQKKEVDNVDLSTVFWFSLTVSILLYIIIYVTSDWIAVFFNESLLSIILKVLSIKLVIGTYNSIQNTIIAKKLMFKINFKTSILATCISGAIALYMALNGFGVWALVMFQVIYQVILSILLFINLKWIPRFVFSFKRFKELYRYGIGILGANMLSIFSEQIYGLFLGKKYSNDIIGYYQRGQQFPQTVVNSMNSTINSTLHPYLAKRNDNPDVMTKLIKEITSGISHIIFPAMLGLYALSYNLILFLLTEKWIYSVKYLRYESIYYMIIPLLAVYIQTNRSLGNSKVSLIIEVTKLLLIIISLFIGIYLGINFIMITRIIIVFVLLIVTIFINKKVLNYSIFDFTKEIYKPLFASIIMMFIVIIVGQSALNLFLTVVLQIVVGICIYLLCLILLKSKYALLFIENIKQKRRKK